VVGCCRLGLGSSVLQINRPATSMPLCGAQSALPILKALWRGHRSGGANALKIGSNRGFIQKKPAEWAFFN